MTDKANEAAQQHGGKVDEGLDKAGEQAKEKFGHGEQVDQGVEKAEEFLSGDE